MEVIVHKVVLYGLLDALIRRWKAKEYPYNHPDAIIPQTIIPAEIRSCKTTLACFYFFACIYMRGGIESLQAFGALIRMWREHPHLFDPAQASLRSEQEVREVLKRFIGWDSAAAARNWVVNSQRLVDVWDGDPQNLIRGLTSYEEACRWIRNKRTKGEMASAGNTGAGFRGFQYKMVSMLLYFYDWEGLMQPRIPYPSPADFHNFRLGFAVGAIEIRGNSTDSFTINEKVSRPWRDAVLSYIKDRDADPIELCDALWLYSLVLCGNSPFTTTSESPPEADPAHLFAYAELKEEWDEEKWKHATQKQRIEKTCLACEFQPRCSYAIPSRPYYRKGKFVLRKRRRFEESIDPRLLKPTRTGVTVKTVTDPGLFDQYE